MNKTSLIISIVAVILFVAVVVYIWLTIKRSKEHKPDFGNHGTENHQQDNNNDEPIPTCDVEPEPDPIDSNKYFFNIHKYTSLKGNEGFCVICSAVIKLHTYHIVCINSFYPYIKSYTEKAIKCIKTPFAYEHMTVEEFKQKGSSNFERVGEYVGPLEPRER